MTVLIIILLMFLSFFFSGSESALTSLAGYKLRKIYVKNKILRPALSFWLLKPYRIMITILIGNTIVNLLLSSVVAKKVVLSGSLAVNKELKEIFVWILTTSIVLIFCELTPKIVSKNFSEKMSSIVVLPLWLLQYITFFIFSPVLFFVEKRLNKEQNVYFTKTEEIKRMINETAKHIFQRQDVVELFERVTKFDEIRIKDIYTPKDKVIAVDVYKKTLSDIITEVIESGKTRVPVYERDINNILGYVLVKDLFYLCSLSECSIYDIIHPILKANLNDKAKDLLKKIQKTQIHIAAVVDDKNKFYGIITLEDILEEIVGDILDEYDIKPVFSK